MQKILEAAHWAPTAGNTQCPRFYVVRNPEVKKRLGVPENLAACHTAVIDGYVIEGHITHRDIKRLLLFRPEVTGIAVPGMPIGTPGMERGSSKQPYDVMTFDDQGNVEVFVKH